MDRYGSPRFRGAANQGYGQRRPSTGARSILGTGPRSSTPQGAQASRSIHRGGGQGKSLLGPPPRAMIQSSYADERSSSWNESNVHSRMHQMPEEVTQLMKSLGLSQADMKKLSQLPDNELSVDNIARAIGNLKKQSHRYSCDDQSKMYDPSEPTDDHDSYMEEGRFHDKQPSFQRSGMLGASPADHLQQTRMHTSDRAAVGPRSGPKPMGSLRQQRHQESSYHDSRSPFGRDDRNDYYHSDDDSYHHEPVDQYDRGLSDSYNRPKRIVEEVQDDRQPQRKVSYERPRRLETGKSNNSQRPTPRGLLRPPGDPGNARPILERGPPRSNRPNWEQNAPPSGSGLLGNPMQPNARGLESLAAAVGRHGHGSSLSVKQAAETVLNPLLLTRQADPSMLEVQLQAIKVLQAEAMKQRRGGPGLLDQPPPVQKRPVRPRQRSPRAERMERGRQDDLRNDAKKEADAMRAMHGRVLYMRFHSKKIQESDLRQLASAFGKVTNVLIIRTKIPNGFNQAFMEMEQYDCAAAMLERYKAKPPMLLGCQVLVDRSNYTDLHLKFPSDRKRRRSASISPVREGTTQFPSKRPNKGPRLSVSVSDNKRQVTQSGGSAKAARDDEKSGSLRRSRSSDRKRGPDKKASDAKGAKDLRHELNAKLSEDGRNHRRGSDRKVGSDKDDGNDSKRSKSDEETDDKQEADKGKGNEKVKDETDPLDVIASELAMHDEFVLMDEVGYETELKSKPDVTTKPGPDAEKASADGRDDEDQKEAVSELDRKDIDLADIDVDEARAGKDGDDDMDISQQERDNTSCAAEAGDDVDRSVDAEEDAAGGAREKNAGNKEDDASFEASDDRDRESVLGEGGEVVKNVCDAVAVSGDQQADDKPPPTDHDSEASWSLRSRDLHDREGDESSTLVKETDMRQIEESRAEEEGDSAVGEESLERVETAKRDDVSAADDSIYVDAAADETGGPDSFLDQESHASAYDEEEEEEEEDEEALNHLAGSQSDEVARLKFIIDSALQEIENAKEQLNALNKTTKNRATVAASKKLKLCLDGASARLQSAEEETDNA